MAAEVAEQIYSRRHNWAGCADDYDHAHKTARMCCETGESGERYVE